MHLECSWFKSKKKKVSMRLRETSPSLCFGGFLSKLMELYVKQTVTLNFFKDKCAANVGPLKNHAVICHCVIWMWHDRVHSFVQFFNSFWMLGKLKAQSWPMGVDCFYTMLLIQLQQGVGVRAGSHHKATSREKQALTVTLIPVVLLDWTVDLIPSVCVFLDCV